MKVEDAFIYIQKFILNAMNLLSPTYANDLVCLVLYTLFGESASFLLFLVAESLETREMDYAELVR